MAAEIAEVKSTDPRIARSTSCGCGCGTGCGCGCGCCGAEVNEQGDAKETASIEN